ncbi:DUF502 domain-containing protein [Methyloferula stellata]|uniref:DUF502 domain-containing protein n=1 Tax=Methyloferula stellata TaxID=876270 RepID=UPI00036F4232
MTPGRSEILAEMPRAAALPPLKGVSFGARLRNWFLTGVVVAGPLAVTAYIVWWFVDTVDTWVKKLVPVSFWPDTYLPVRVPGLGVIFALLGLTLLGFLAANLAGRTLITLGEAILERMPIIRSIYRGVKQIFETLFAQSGTSFRKVGLIEFPSKGMWSLVFISAPPNDGLAEKLPQGEHYLSVFLPCTPNPTTGFYFFLPAHEVTEVSLTPEDAAKLIMSCGVIQPDIHAVVAEPVKHKPIAEPVDGAGAV